LFSYLQQVIDEAGRMGRFILTGSQNFLLLESITQSLAGRVAVNHLLPLSLKELQTAGGGNGIVLGQVKTDEKSNEITAIPELIKRLELKRAGVKGWCQTFICNFSKTLQLREIFSLYPYGSDRPDISETDMLFLIHKQTTQP
jgi:predicted AAA+ superfamily ATPase